MERFGGSIFLGIGLQGMVMLMELVMMGEVEGRRVRGVGADRGWWMRARRGGAGEGLGDETGGDRAVGQDAGCWAW